MMKKIAKYTGMALLAFVLFTGGDYLYLTFTGNFHPVTEGQAYRSAQLDRRQLEERITGHGIKSVVNLRGSEPGKPWYDDEVSVCAERNVAHYDLSLSARREPSAEDMRAMEEIFRTAPRPVLIHCLGGADRSGLAGAVWKVVVDGQDGETAGKQLTIFYGHLPYGQFRAMDRCFERWYRSRSTGDTGRR
jgi:undecaprenyl-diphosphatase